MIIIWDNSNIKELIVMSSKIISKEMIENGEIDEIKTIIDNKNESNTNI